MAIGASATNRKRITSNEEEPLSNIVFLSLPVELPRESCFHVQRGVWDLSDKVTNTRKGKEKKLKKRRSERVNNEEMRERTINRF